MKETDIRPKNLDNNKFKALEKDLKFLRSKLPEFTKVSCPACDSSKFNYKFTKYGFNFDQCTHCRTVFMNPRATPEILSLFIKTQLYMIIGINIYFRLRMKLEDKRLLNLGYQKFRS